MVNQFMQVKLFLGAGVSNSYRENTPISGLRSVLFFSSPLRGEDTGEGDGCRRPLTLALSHKGRGDLKLSVC